MIRRLTLSRLAVYLNNRWGCKSTGKKFTAQDAQGYITRGRIPYEYGGELVILDEGLLESTGVKAYRLEKRVGKLGG
jgi:hypothetical protein